MRRLRVMFLIGHAAESGGAERFVLGLATFLPRDRFEVWVCSTRLAEPAAVDILQAAGVRHVHLGRRTKTDAWRFVRLARLLRRGRFDVLHTHLFGSNLWGSIIGRLCGTPVVIAEEHTWSYVGNPLRKFLDGYLIGRLVTRFIAVSDHDAQRMVEIEHVPREKVLVIPSAYVPRPPAKTDLRGELGLAESTPLLAAVAILREQKALDVLLDALVDVLAAEPNTHLVIAGDGPCRPELTEQAARLAISDHVHFLGHRDDAEGVLAAADIAVISSDYEGMPLVAFESFANRTPLVATAVGGLVDFIEDRETGRLVPRRDPPALAAAIIELIRDEALRRRIAAAAAERSAQMSIESIAERFATLYEQLAGVRPTTAGDRRPSP